MQRHRRAYSETYGHRASGFFLEADFFETVFATRACAVFSGASFFRCPLAAFFVEVTLRTLQQRKAVSRGAACKLQPSAKWLTLPWSRSSTPRRARW